MREHEIDPATLACRHCGNTAARCASPEVTCLTRPDPPERARPKPPSLFDDLAAIGKRAQEIRAEEDKARAGASEAA